MKLNSPHYLLVTSLLVVLLFSACVSTYDINIPESDNQALNVNGKVKKNKNTTEHILSNGLKVIVKEDHRSPVVASMVWYKVGGSYEPEGLTGIAHVFEHMMFKGTEKYLPNEFSQIIAENGGQDNAFTGRDYTAYFQQLEKSRLPISFELEADRMRNLKITEKEYLKELEVVKEERRLRTDDKPEAYVYEAFNKAAYDVSNYKNPIIGWPEDLEALTVDKMKPWYIRYYAPNNATLVVVGDVEPKNVFALAKKYFGQLPMETIPSAPRILEPLHTQQRRIFVERKAKVPYMMMGFQAPALRPENDQDWEPYALIVLKGVLDGGKSARFEKNLIREQKVAASTWINYDPVVRLDGMIMLGATPAQNIAVDELEKSIWKQLNRVKSVQPTEKELQRVKAQIAAEDVFQKDSVFYQAMSIGRLETIGLNWRLENEWLSRVQQVTPEQVQKVAQKYLVVERSTVAILKPLKANN